MTSGTGPEGMRAADWLVGGGEMGKLIRDKDWSCTPLGPIENWPQSLRTAVSICLASNFPINIIWGPRRIQIYNDGYWPICGAKHPHSMGQDFKQCWASAWPAVGEPFENASVGKTDFLVNERMFLDRNGYLEETFFTFSFSPIRDESGGVGGLFHPVTEMTQPTLAQRRLKAVRDLADHTAELTTVTAACQAITQALAQHHLDVPFALLYLLDANGERATLAGCSGLEPGTLASPVDINLRAPPGDRWPLTQAGDRQVLEVDELDRRFGSITCPPHPEPPRTAVVLPINLSGVPHTFGVLVAGVSARRALDEPYRMFHLMLRESVTNALTNARAYEQERRRAEALAELDRAKTEFFSNVSHEFRTPLTLIMGPVAELRAAKDVDPARLHTELEVIHRNGLRLGKLVNTLLEFSRIQAGRVQARYEPVNLGAVTTELASVFRAAIERAGLRLEVDCADCEQPVHLDREMWEKVVLNLLSNALKFTFDGHISVTVRRGDNTAVVTVADTGTGIPAEELPRLFDRFHRVRGARARSHEGSGIGLALAAELVALHGGTITAESVLGVGTTFSVTLPLGSAHLPADQIVPAATVIRAGQGAAPFVEEALRWLPDAPDVPDDAGSRLAGAQPLGPAGRRVLIADDNADMREYLQRLLAARYQVQAVGDGMAALHAAKAATPDLIVADVMMPGMDGIELVAALRADVRTAGVPVLMLSARAGQEAAIEGLAAGADDYLIKPFTAGELLARIQANLDMARLRSREGAWRTALLNTLRDGLFVLDATGAVIEINEAFTEILGYGPDGLPYLPPYPWWPDAAEDPQEAAQIAQAMADFRSSPGAGRWLLPLRHRDRHRVWADISTDSVTAPPAVDPAGTVLEPSPHVVGIIRDVTSAHYAEQRDKLLAETATLIIQPGPVEQRIQRLVTVIAGVFEQLVVVMRTGPDRLLSTVAAAHPVCPEHVQTILGLAPITLPAGVTAAAQAGQPVVLDPVGDELHQIGVHIALIAPLTISGRVLGLLGVLATTRPRRFDQAERDLVQELAHRLAGLLESDRITTREHQLRQASTALAAATTVADAAAALAHAVTEALGASGIAIYTLHPDDPTGLHLEHNLGLPAEFTARFSRIDVGGSFISAHTVRTGQPLWLGDPQTYRTRFAHLGQIDGIRQAQAVAALPLRVGQHILGALAATFPTTREFPAPERDFAVTLVGQAAQAFERAALTDHRWRIAQTLQHSLLPHQLPEFDRLVLATRYLPGAPEVAAGGDWYDVLALDNHQVAIVVGDVVGQGAAAAAVMGQLRTALATALLHGDSPADALEHLHRLAARIPGALASTAAVMILDLDSGQLCWARAGHPPPLLVESDQSRYLTDGAGGLLGVARRPYRQAATRIQPGACLLLYTDGLIERRGQDLDRGLDHLAATAGALCAQPPTTLIDGVLANALPGTGPADDVALIAARYLPAPLHQQLPADPAQLPGLRRMVRAWASANALPTAQVEDLHITLGEATANAAEHAYTTKAPGRFTYRLTRRGDGALDVEVRDFGRWRAHKPGNTHRGRGLAMIREIATDVVIDARPEGTQIRFHLPALPPDPAPPIPAGQTQPTAATPPASPELRVHPQSGGGRRLQLRGELDLAAATALSDQLLEQLDTPGPVILDLRDLTYLSSAGVGLLIQATQHAAEHRIPLQLELTPHSIPAQVLALTGIEHTLLVATDAAEQAASAEDPAP